MRVYRDDQKFLTFRINAAALGDRGRLRFPGRLVLVSCRACRPRSYRGLSEANALREIVIAGQARSDHRPQRKKILADNQPAYSLMLRPRDHAPICSKTDPTIQSTSSSPFSRGTPRHPAAGDRRRASKRRRAIPSITPIPIAEDLTMAQVAAIQAQSVAFPELNVDPGAAPQLSVRNDGRARHGLHRRGQRQRPRASTTISNRAI